ncbi:MAG: M20/M25/M40 family metallo-hydrolase [Desulfobacterales bacterium]|nr:M20/M25/M40 family metallo-hydrolase [Desulfobacterales bacterium]
MTGSRPSSILIPETGGSRASCVPRLPGRPDPGRHAPGRPGGPRPGNPRAPAPGTLDPSSLEPFAGTEDKLAALVRRPTISRFEEAQEEDGPFRLLPGDLERLFPLVHARLRRDAVGARGLLYEWTGADPGLAPAVLAAHYDVVPPGEIPWTRPPFSGDVAGGLGLGPGFPGHQGDPDGDPGRGGSASWPRASGLPAPSISPSGGTRRSGLPGRRRPRPTLREREVRASFLVDEGGIVADGMLPFADRPPALVGIAEKGYVDVELEARGAGGHASMPPRSTAAGTLSRAVARLESRPFPARLTRTVRSFLSDLSPYVPFALRLLFRSPGLSAFALIRAFSAAPTTNALVRTTQAATMLSGSDKENVLPDRARAVINVRILPGQTVAGVLARMASIVARDGVTVRQAHEGLAVEPLPESPTDHEGYRAVRAALEAAHPEAAVVPFLFSAGTDSKHYADIVQAICRIAPIRQTSRDLAGVHGPDERISVENVRRCALFYYELMKGM